MAWSTIPLPRIIWILESTIFWVLLKITIQSAIHNKFAVIPHLWALGKQIKPSTVFFRKLSPIKFRNPLVGCIKPSCTLSRCLGGCQLVISRAPGQDSFATFFLSWSHFRQFAAYYNFTTETTPLPLWSRDSWLTCLQFGTWAQCSQVMALSCVEHMCRAQLPLLIVWVFQTDRVHQELCFTHTCEVSMAPLI